MHALLHRRLREQVAHQLHGVVPGMRVCVARAANVKRETAAGVQQAHSEAGVQQAHSAVQHSLASGTIYWFRYW